MSTALHINGKKVTLSSIERKGSELRFVFNGKPYSFRGARGEHGQFLLEQMDTRTQGTIWPLGKGGFKIALGALEGKVSPVVSAAAGPTTEAPLSPLAPMPGLVRQVLVKKGDKVTQGQALAVMEAMKLQTTLKAGGDGVVEAVLVKEGDMVAEGAELVRLVTKK